MTGLELFYAFSLLVIPPLFIAAFVADRLFRRQLRSRHPEVLASMGSSSPQWRRPMAKSIDFVGFVWTSRYLDLGDPELNHQATWLKGFLGCYFVAFFLLLVVLMTTHGGPINR